VELVSLAPDVIVAGGAAPTRALQQATKSIPIVFTGGGDAAAIGLVKNIARPRGSLRSTGRVPHFGGWAPSRPTSLASAGLSFCSGTRRD
jgi:hypothetical protein